MAYKLKARQALAAHSHYVANAAKIKTRARKFSDRQVGLLKSIVRNYLASHPCVDCDESDIVVLEFDHINRSKKIGNISTMVRSSVSVEKLVDEIKKCEVRCANCHRRKTVAEVWITGEKSVRATTNQLFLF